MYAYRNMLLTNGGTILAEFSSHWAACAAMIRMSNPDFKSLGGDRPGDLAIEQEIRGANEANNRT